MRLWDEMMSKNGFNDGNSVPTEAEACREAYIRSVNTIAEKLGSQFRAVAFDRGGFHNWCLILFYPLEATDGASIDQMSRHMMIADEPVDEVDTDQAMQDAISLARQFDPDEQVNVKVSLSRSFNKQLREFVKEVNP